MRHDHRGLTVVVLVCPGPRPGGWVGAPSCYSSVRMRPAWRRLSVAGPVVAGQLGGLVTYAGIPASSPDRLAPVQVTAGGYVLRRHAGGGRRQAGPRAVQPPDDARPCPSPLGGAAARTAARVPHAPRVAAGLVVWRHDVTFGMILGIATVLFTYAISGDLTPA